MIQKEIWKKLAKGEKLSPQEEFQFVEFADRLQLLETLVNGMIAPVDHSLSLKNPRIAHPNWETSPLHSMEMVLTTNTTVSHATPKYITFDSVNNKGSAFDSSDLQKIEKAFSGYSTHFDGVAVFDNNATGYRALYLELFSINGVSLGASPFFLLPGHNLEDNWFPFTFTHNNQGVHYFKVYAYQTSGGDLSLLDLYMTVKVA
jgi:hypothetical protein